MLAQHWAEHSPIVLFGQVIHHTCWGHCLTSAWWSLCVQKDRIKILIIYQLMNTCVFITCLYKKLFRSLETKKASTCWLFLVAMQEYFKTTNLNKTQWSLQYSLDSIHLWMVKLWKTLGWKPTCMEMWWYHDDNINQCVTTRIQTYTCICTCTCTLQAIISH